jgi:hypothetical protein
MMRHSQRQRCGQNPLQKSQAVLETTNETNHTTKSRSGNSASLFKSSHPFTKAPQDLERDVTSTTSDDDVLASIGSSGASVSSSSRLLVAAEQVPEGDPPASERDEVRVYRGLAAPALGGWQQGSMWVIRIKGSIGSIRVLMSVGARKTILNGNRRANTGRRGETVSMIGTQFHCSQKVVEILSNRQEHHNNINK